MRTRDMKWMPLLGTGLAVRMDLLNEQWAQKNHSQSLERLAERGGLSCEEALAIAERRQWSAQRQEFESFRALAILVPNAELQEQLATVTKQRDELAAALRQLWISCPTGLECNSFHHTKQDRHGYAEECKPAAEYLEALDRANAALAKLDANKEK